ncbi:MAG: hypothetical protein J6M02_00305 [Clostridia bacterium]|nr:hypothetical protein [Clostridia bacterium]
MKKNFKETTVTILFLLLLFYFSATTIFSNHSEIQSVLSEKLLTVQDKIAAIDNIFNTKLTNFDNLLNLYSLTQKALNTSLYDDIEYGFIIRDNHDSLHFPYYVVDTKPCAEKTIRLYENLKELGTPFLYIQAPNKKLKNYTVYPVGGHNYSNEDADQFLEQLQQNNVPYLDLRKSIEQGQLDKSDLFYKTDHHWTTETAFYGYTKIAETLNQTFHLPLSEKYTNRQNYASVTYPHSFLGSLGRRIGKYAVGIDDYTFFYPKFETNYEIYFSPDPTTEPAFSGDFMTAIAKENLLSSTNIKDNKYASYFEYEYGNLVVKNKLADNHLKILMIKDSFSLPVAAFLSTAVEELHMIDLRYPGAPNPYEYAKGHHFDLVMVLYNTHVFDISNFHFINE